MYHTETERIAHEAFDRALLGGSTFYVNGRPWKEGDALPGEHPHLEIVSRRNLWDSIPRVQTGLAANGKILLRLAVYLALASFEAGMLLALCFGAYKLVEAVCR